MPALNPRISVTVQPSVEAVLSRLSSLTKQSKSSLIADLLDSSMPIFQRMVTVLEAASMAKDSLRTQALSDLEDGERKLQELLGVTMDIFDSHTLPIIQQAEEITRRKGQAVAVGMPRGAPRSRPVRPPHVTRGSGTPNKAKGAIAERQKQPSTRSVVQKSISKASKTTVAASKKKVKG